jgi:hypothetical protein
LLRSQKLKSDVQTAPTHVDRHHVSVRRGLRRLLAVVLSLLWSYLVAALLYAERFGGITIGRSASLVLVLVGTVICFVVAGRLAEGRQKDLLAASVSLLLALFAADTAFTMWINVQNSRDPSMDRVYERLSDPRIWHGELYPRSYYPSDLNFTLFKPNVRVEAVTYGEFYEQRMLKSPTLTHSVLRLRPLVYTVDENGLRNRISVEASRVWALGDSFAFGFSTTEGSTWIDRLVEQTGRPVYNLGVSGTGPVHQLQLLEHVLRTRATRARPEQLLWMLFEGNDLENNTVERRPLGRDVGTSRAALENTIFGDVLALPGVIRQRSILGRLREGELRFGRLASRGGDDPYLVDGVPIATPLYRSSRWGPCMFDPHDIDVATRDEDYVLSHPNRAPLDRSFDAMKSLAKEFGFRVTVMVAPSAPRLYGRDFPTMPQPASEPYFIRYVEALAHRMNFETIDLLGALNPGHDGAMLYYCDDHHWNERGNEVVARVIADAAFGQTPDAHPAAGRSGGLAR